MDTQQIHFLLNFISAHDGKMINGVPESTCGPAGSLASCGEKPQLADISNIQYN
jgi:hypothetical protein